MSKHKYIENQSSLGVFMEGYLNLYEAAHMITVMDYFSGNIEVDEEKLNKLNNSSFFSKSHKEFFNQYTTKSMDFLLDAISKNDIETYYTERRRDGGIIPDTTFIKDTYFSYWLEERGIYNSDIYEDDYMDIKIRIYELLEDIIDVEKKRIENDLPSIHVSFDLKQTIANMDSEKLYSESNHNKEEKKDTPLHPKVKKSLLKIVLAMSVKKYRFNPNVAKNSATANIVSDIRELGLSADNDTVLKWLREAAKEFEGEFTIT